MVRGSARSGGSRRWIVVATRKRNERGRQLRRPRIVACYRQPGGEVREVPQPTFLPLLHPGGTRAPFQPAFLPMAEAMRRAADHRVSKVASTYPAMALRTNIAKNIPDRDSPIN